MMKLSTKGRYGLRAIAELAARSDKPDPVPLAAIAQKQNISEKYLESMFSMLKKARLIRSVKGAGGGYVLARDAKNIMVSEVLRVLEGDLHIVDDEHYAEANNPLWCLTKKMVWDTVHDRVSGVLSSSSLEDLIKSKQQTDN